MLLEGMKALITGSRRGIGRGVAVALAKEGADIGINDIERDEAAEDTMEMVRAEGRNVTWHLADIARRLEVDQMVDEFVGHHGRIDILINNAVASRKKPFLDITEEDWDFEVGNALKGYFLCSQRAAREMVNQGDGGRIVSIASVQAFVAWPNNTVYGVCKAGVVRMTMSLAMELGKHGIACNAVAPGYIDSRVLPEDQEHLRAGPGYADDVKPLIPLRRGGVPREIAGVVLALCSWMGDYVTGQCVTVDGGLLKAGLTSLGAEHYPGGKEDAPRLVGG
jgi:NAD(P)-dependent dehydrogenase (short-subunit alcohol dehydrogenase family)